MQSCNFVAPNSFLSSHFGLVGHVADMPNAKLEIVSVFFSPTENKCLIIFDSLSFQPNFKTSIKTIAFQVKRKRKKNEKELCNTMGNNFSSFSLPRIFNVLRDLATCFTANFACRFSSLYIWKGDLAGATVGI
jgi:hypothetical protein